MDDGLFWLALGSIAQVLAAAATFAAVLVSLRLARQSSEPRLIFSVHLTAVPGEEWEEEISLIVSNVGPLPEKIIGVGWEVGWFRKHRRLVSLIERVDQPGLPRDLKPGEGIVYRGSLSDFIEEVRIHPRIYYLHLPFGLRVPRPIRAILHTWSGPSPRAPLGKALKALAAGRPRPEGATVNYIPKAGVPEIEDLHRLWRDGRGE